MRDHVSFIYLFMVRTVKWGRGKETGERERERELKLNCIILIGALAVLAQEVVPTKGVGLPSASYRKIVACALLYKVNLSYSSCCGVVTV